MASSSYSTGPPAFAGFIPQSETKKKAYGFSFLNFIYFDLFLGGQTVSRAGPCTKCSLYREDGKHAKEL
jgi:hypothetical protein